MIENIRITYAQNREDIILAAFFDDDETGFYVDVGAEAPTELSVTKNFYNRGWRGINIEPITRQHDLFVAERPRDINLNIGVSDKPGYLSFREYVGSGYSTFSEEMKKDHVVDDENATKEFKDYEIEVQTLSAVFESNSVTSIQFLKIDVEGLEYEVIKGNDWEKYRPEVICIEANHVKRDWRKLLANNSYEFVFFDGLNEYYSDAKTDRAAKFDYVRGVMLKGFIVDDAVVGELLSNENKVQTVHLEVDRLNAELVMSRQQTKNLQAALNDITPLKRHIVKSVKHKLVGFDRKVIARLSRRSSFEPQRLMDSQGVGPAAVVRDYDLKNYESYVALRKDSWLLPHYLHVRTSGHRYVRSALSKVARKR